MTSRTALRGSLSRQVPAALPGEGGRGGVSGSWPHLLDCMSVGRQVGAGEFWALVQCLVQLIPGAEDRSEGREEQGTYLGPVYIINEFV